MSDNVPCPWLTPSYLSKRAGNVARDGEKKRHGLHGDYEVACSMSIAYFWPVTTPRDEALAVFNVAVVYRSRPAAPGF